MTITPELITQHQLTPSEYRKIVTLLGRQPSYTELGATASDNCGTGLTVTTLGSVNVNVISTYTITYQATDAGANTGNVVTLPAGVKNRPSALKPAGPSISSVPRLPALSG